MKIIKTLLLTCLLFLCLILSKTTIAQTGTSFSTAITLTTSVGYSTGWQTTNFDTIWYKYQATSEQITYHLIYKTGFTRTLERIISYKNTSYLMDYQDVMPSSDSSMKANITNLVVGETHYLAVVYKTISCSGCSVTPTVQYKINSVNAPLTVACSNPTVCVASPLCELVCNGSFEIIGGQSDNGGGTIPLTHSQISMACGWNNANVGNATVDLFDATGAPMIDIPCNMFGDESERTGKNNYAGFFAYSTSALDYKESLFSQLKTPLLSGHTYQVSFYLSLADQSVYNVTGSNVGVAFSNNYTPGGTNYNINTVSGGTQYFNTSSLSMTGWQQYSFSYSPVSANEQFIILGALKTSSTITSITASSPCGGPLLSNPYASAYYYLDDVSVTEITDYTVTPHFGAGCPPPINGLSVNPSNSAGSYTWSSSPVTPTLSTVNIYSVAISPTATTIYTVDALGCGTETISVDPAVITTSFSASSSASVICAGSTVTLSASSSGLTSYTWTSSPSTSTLSTQHGATVVVSPSVNTTYTVIGSYTGCSNTYSSVVTVSVTTGPSIGISTSSIVCVGTAVTVTAGVNTSLGNVVFYDTNNQYMTNPYTFTTPGSYTVYADGSESVCNTFGSVEIPITVVASGSNPTLTITPSITVCAGTTKTLTVGGATSYTWSSGSNSFSITVTPTITTTYTVTGATACGSSTAAVTLSVIPIPSLTITASPTVICAGNSSTLSATGATTYTWSTSAYTSSTSVSPTVTTTYTITGANACGTKTAAITVSVNATPTISITGTTTICSGNSTTLTASGALSYTWNPGGVTTGSVSINPSVTTIYTVTGKNAAGCVVTKTVVVNVTASPIITSIPSSNSVCPGFSATLTATGGTTYTWSPASTLNTANGSSVIATPTANTIYTVSASTASCGIKTGTVFVSIIPPPTISISSPSLIICPGGTTTLTASGATSYTWQPVSVISSSISVTPTVATVYTVTGSNSCGATSTQTVKVSFFKGNPSISASASPSLICAGSSSTLTATSAAGNWIFIYPGSMSSGTVVSPTITTTYTAIATNTNTGCSASAIITVSVNPFSGLTVTPSTICAGQSSTISATGATSYTWSNGANTSSIVVSPSVTTVYTLSATGASCTANTTVTLSVNANPTLTVTASPSVICSGSSSTLTASGASTYTWLPTNITGSVSVVTPTATTIYTITGTNAAVCTTTTTISIIVNPTPTINIVATKTIICTGDTPTLTASGASSYTWNTGANTASIVITPTSTVTYYTVTATSGSCSATKTILIVKLNPPNITASATPTVICSGSSSTLTASGASSYSWQPMGVTGYSTAVTPSATTIYTVIGTNPGCSRTQTVAVNVTTTPTITAIANPTAYCSGISPTITASGATSYSWSSGATTSSIVVSPTVATVYTVTGNNGSCIGNTIAFTIGVGTTPTITATANPTSMCVGNPATLTATGATSYSWSTGATTSVTTVTPGAISIYTVTGMNGACGATATVQVILTGQYCCQSSIATIGTSTASSINYSNNSNGSGAVVDVQGQITFTANSTMSNYIIRMAPQASIFISPNVTVTFSNCTIYSCTELWQGIWIPDISGDAGNLNVINSTIEDMYLGIIMFGNSSGGYPTSSNGIVNITNSKLNKNYISVNLNTFPKYNNGNLNYGLSVTGSTISSVYSNTSPLNTLKPSSVYSYNYNNINNSSVPYTNFPRSYVGIYLIELSEAPVIIGDKTGSGGTNRFENLDFGISVNNAVLKAYNNHFINIKGSSKQYLSTFPPTSGPPGPDEIGVAISAYNTTTTGVLYSITVGDASSTPSGGNPFPEGNKFENCFKGIRVDGYKDLVKLKANVFTSTLTTVTPIVSPASPLYSYRQAQSAIWVTNTQVNAELTNNYILNHNNGIYSSHNILSSYLSSAYIKVEDNLVEAPGTTGYCKQAIQVEQVNGTTNLNTGMLTVKNNTLQNVYGGIRAYLVKGGLQINDNPTINLDAAKLYGITNSVTNPSNYARTAIYVQSCTDAVVANNPNITSNGTIPATYSTVKGIWMNGSSGTTGEVNCNTISNMGRCMQFTGTSLNKVAKNVMNGTYQGLVLSVNGQIGTQGSTSLTNDNEWNGFTGGASQYAETYTESSNNANTNSILFVKPGSPYQPTQNYSSTGAPYVTGPANGIDPQSLSTPGETCLSLKVIGGSNINSAAMKTSATNEGDSTNTTIYESLASDTTYYEVYSDETQYRNKQLVYELLNSQSIDTTIALQNFYTANQNSSYDDFSTINTSISNGDYSTAQNINNAVTAVNTIETYQKRVNELLLKYLNYHPQPVITSSLSIPVFNNAAKIFDDTELNDLNTIASSCLDKYGSVVAQARVLLNNISNRIIDFDDNCVPEYNQRKAKPFTQPVIIPKAYSVIYPNPNNGNMILEYNLGDDTKGEMRIFDISGKLVSSYNLQQAIGKIEMNEQNLMNGVYYYSIILNGKITSTNKIVIIK